MNTPDMEVVLSAMEDARRILDEYIEPGRLRDPAETPDRLLVALDREDLIHALDRLNRPRVIRLVE
jgi:phage gp36-like protein